MAIRMIDSEETGRKRGGRPQVTDALPDRLDLRDWWYQPTLSALPDTLVNCGEVPTILDQGASQGCTGFALAAVIHLLLARRNVSREVSPRMLYEMARCHDKWPGESYEGSTGRGAIKGWTRHGVCTTTEWPDSLHGRENLDDARAFASLETPAGSYYRVKPQAVRDAHAALAEVGAIYCTAAIHGGWDYPDGAMVEVTDKAGVSWRLPTIQRVGTADRFHAVALVGYTREGFVVQNSWGTNWGADGFAVWPYEDYLLHATDIWVAQLGVPVNVDLWSAIESPEATTGRFRASAEIPIAQIRPFVVNAGNNGKLSQSGNYWTTVEDVKRLFHRTILDTANTRGWDKRRVMIYLHGGLTNEKASARRVIAYRDKFLANGIYPLHLMWESGGLQTIGNILEDIFTSASDRAGATLLEGLGEARDFALELTASPLGTPMWDEMKENARLLSERRDGQGAMQLMATHAASEFAELPSGDQADWELHVVAHSAGSIVFAHALETLCSLKIPLKSVQLMAPAIEVDLYKELVVPMIGKGCPKPKLYVLSEEQEKADECGPYGKSLLWLVSNSFEDRRGTPVLGMQHYLKRERTLRDKYLGEIVESLGKAGPSSAACTAVHHGDFDDDAATVNSVIKEIIGARAEHAFEPRDLRSS